MQNHKKIIAIMSLIVIMLIMAISVLSGCANHLEDEVVIGDFVCQVRSNGTVNLKNLSEEGKKKKYIVVPQELNGMRVEMLGYRNAVFSPGRSNWQSDNLEKIFICAEDINFLHSLFNECPKVDKVIIINSNCNDLEGYGSKISVFNSLINYQQRSEYQNQLLWEYSNIYVSNISYYYNYEESPNNGYYWIDDIEDGELIEYIPEEPIREGYIFEGWYKEKECINEWNFEKDRVVKAKVGVYTEYIENKLFAKWAKE